MAGGGRKLSLADVGFCRLLSAGKFERGGAVCRERPPPNRHAGPPKRPPANRSPGRNRAFLRGRRPKESPNRDNYIEPTPPIRQERRWKLYRTATSPLKSILLFASGRRRKWRTRNLGLLGDYARLTPRPSAIFDSGVPRGAVNPEIREIGLSKYGPRGA